MCSAEEEDRRSLEAREAELDRREALLEAREAALEERMGPPRRSWLKPTSET